MKRIKITLVLLVVGLLLAPGIKAQDIISATDLNKVMKNDNVVVVSARTPADYKKVHITGAVHINLTELYADKSMLKDAKLMAEIIGKAGVNESMKIVIYDDGLAKSSGRLYWILSYMGAKDVKVLDGGMKAWRASRKPVTKNPTKVTAATFTTSLNKEIYASMDLVKKAIGNSSYLIVDARTSEEFSGAKAEDVRPGHIPSAINLDFTKLLKESGELKSNAELQAIFEVAGMSKDKDIILYCKSGVRAGIVFLALKSALNYPSVRIYDGAYLEWSSVGFNNVETD